MMLGSMVAVGVLIFQGLLLFLSYDMGYENARQNFFKESCEKQGGKVEGTYDLVCLKGDVVILKDYSWN
jgi:hypothetical protein